MKRRTLVRYFVLGFFSAVSLAFAGPPRALAADPGQSGQEQQQQQKAKAPEQTLKNLKSALQGEVTASHRYELFAKKADEEGYQPVANLFRAASKSESIHADNHRNAIRQLGGQVPDVKPEQVVVRSTRQNLEEPIRGEWGEANRMYPRYIQQAKRDGAEVAANSFTFARNAEAQHLKLFESALKNLGKNPPREYLVQKKTGETISLPQGTALTQRESQDFIRVG